MQYDTTPDDTGNKKAGRESGGSPTVSERFGGPTRKTLKAAFQHSPSHLENLDQASAERRKWTSLLKAVGTFGKSWDELRQEDLTS